jgi:hypothetical protein
VSSSAILPAAFGAPAQPTPSVQNLRPPSQLRFNLDSVQPPSMLYVGLDDRLHVQLYASFNLPGAPVLVVRILKVDGTISIQEERLPITALATITTFAFYVPEGYILNASVSTGGTICPRGLLYCQIDIIRGAGKDGTQKHKLSGGYLSLFNSVCWPETVADPPALGHGALLQLPITAAAGQEFQVVAPTGSRARLLSIYAIFVTSAAVSTRQPLFTLGPGPVFSVPAPSNQAASLTQYYSGGPGVGYQVAIINRCTFPTPVDFWVPGGAAIVTSSTGGLQAGDQYTGTVAVELCIDN